MRNVIAIVFVAALAVVGCQSTPTVRTQAAAPATALIPPFQPMLMTNFETQISNDEPWSCIQKSNDGTWQVEVSETNVAVSRFPGLTGEGWPGRANSGASTLAIPWKAGPRWLVFAENDYRVWAYDGDQLLFQFTFSETWNKESWHYVGSGAGPSYGDQGTPVPAEVFTRLSEQLRKKIKSHG